MKKTININLGGFVFQIDEDAYDRLNHYLEALKQRFTHENEQEEIIQDIEYRFAEIFGSNNTKTREVISLDLVNQAIATMGEPEEIEEELDQNQKDTNSHGQKNNTSNFRKLFRDPDDKIFAGVIAGLSKFLGVKDAIWFRILMILLVLGGIGFPIIIYFVLWFIVPEAKNTSEKLQMSGETINLENIEEQVKKKINTDEVKKTTVKIANKFSEIGPVILKVLAIFIILLFILKLLGLSFFFLGGGLFMAGFQSDYIQLVFNSNLAYYLALISLYALIAIPIVLALFLAIKVLARHKINWVYLLITVVCLFVLSISGILYSTYDIASNFKKEIEQTNGIELQDPTVDEIEILFPYEKIQDDLDIKITSHKNKMHIEGFELVPHQKLIKKNGVKLNIEIERNDSVFTLSKKVSSAGRSVEEAEEHLYKIENELEIVSEKMLSIPNLLLLKDETKWRNQKLSYYLNIPVGKRVHFGENAKKIIDQVDFASNYSRKDLANNTWEMTATGLICLTCNDDQEI